MVEEDNDDLVLPDDWRDGEDDQEDDEEECEGVSSGEESGSGLAKGGHPLSRTNSTISSPKYPAVIDMNSISPTSLRRTRSAGYGVSGTKRRKRKRSAHREMDIGSSGSLQQFDIQELMKLSSSLEQNQSSDTAAHADVAFTASNNADNEIAPYTEDNQLAYLEECFQVVALMIRGYAARMKDDMKKEGTRLHNWDGGEVKHGRRELQAKLKLLEGRIAMRVQMTTSSLPRLEILASRLSLDAFEKKVILFLIGKTVSPVVKVLLESLGDSGSRGFSDDTSTVGQCLAMLCSDFKTQVDYRKYFYKSGKLLQNGIISLNRNRWHQGSGDLTDQRVLLDRRILDWAVGLDSEINELVEGSDLYEPKVNLCQVVLPQGHLQSLLSQCMSYDAFRGYRLKCGLDKTMSYGNSLVILLCGKSGTGKTMTVNAIAKEMGKKVLLIDFGGLTSRKDGSDMDADLKGLFREANMNNAVIFFDECEVVFRSRNLGGDRILNSLLTEIEKHEGIVFLATNRPYELDEAMHRRITAVVEYQSPDHIMRRLIWENLLADKLTLAPCVDVAALAIKYDLSGGFIKNAVLSAVLSALSRDKENPVLSQEDLVMGCKLQMRGSMGGKMERDFHETSKLSLENLVLTTNQRDLISAITRFETSRARVYGSWYSAPNDRANNSSSPMTGTTSSVDTSRLNTQRACITLMAGPAGSGKKTLAYAISHELGRKIKLVHTSDLLGSTDSTISMLNSIIQDAKLADSLVAIDGFEHILDDHSSESAGGGWKIQLLLSRILEVLFHFPGCVLLICNIDSPQNINMHRDFATKLFCSMKFTVPPSDVRAKLWKLLLPPYAPLSTDVNVTDLGRRFELYPGSIRSTIARACAEASTRTGGNQEIRQKDLLLAGEAEVAMLRGGNYELMQKLFT